jgi:polar amino acid transport system substrate-binding protein
MARLLAPSGTLRASINLGNAVLAQGSHDDPRGITVDLAREVARRLEAPVEFVTFDAARESFAAMTDGRADLGFLAIEPARAAEVRFTPPYVVIDGVYVVGQDSSLRSIADVDADGVRIAVKQGSAYDLFLTRTLQHAELVRSDESLDAYADRGLEVGAGIRQPIEAWVATHPGHRVIPERFMAIRQALVAPAGVPDGALDFLTELLDELIDSGFVRESLNRAGQPDAQVATAADR